MHYLKTVGSLIAALALGITTSYAATQGTLGTTSTGTTDISLTIPALVRISGLSDITLTPANITTDATGNTTACIYSNQSATPGGYVITATSGNGGAGTFVATDGTNNLNYTSTWDDGGGATGLTSGTKLTGQTGANQTQIDCGGGSNSTFAITFAAAAMQAVPQGTYLDTVTLLVSPT